MRAISVFVLLLRDFVSLMFVHWLFSPFCFSKTVWPVAYCFFCRVLFAIGFCAAWCKTNQLQSQQKLSYKLY